MRARLIIVMIVGLMTLSGCYHTKTRQHDAYTTTNAMNYADSSFYSTHHYAQNYNFVVKSDTLSRKKRWQATYMERTSIPRVGRRKTGTTDFQLCEMPNGSLRN